MGTRPVGAGLEAGLLPRPQVQRVAPLHGVAALQILPGLARQLHVDEAAVVRALQFQPCARPHGERLRELHGQRAGAGAIDHIDLVRSHVDDGPVRLLLRVCPLALLRPRFRIGSLPFLHRPGVHGSARERCACSLASRMHGREVPFEQVHIPQKLQHEGRGGPVVDLFRRARLFDAAAVEHHHPVGHFHGLILVVGDEHAGDVHLVVQAPQPAAQLLAHLGIERPEGFVQQQHLRFHGQRPGERDALALAPGELLRVAVGQPVELYQFQQRVHPPADVGLGRPAAARHDPQPEGHVLEDGHVVEQRVVLEHEAHAPRLRVGMGGIGAMKEHTATVGLLQPGDDAQQRGLARAGRPQQRHQRAGRNVQRDVVADHGGAEALVQMIDQDAHVGCGMSATYRQGSTTSARPITGRSARLSKGVRRQRQSRCQMPKARHSSASLGMRPWATSGAVTAPACETMLPGGTERVSQTLPPMTEPRPMVTRPSTVAPA